MQNAEWTVLDRTLWVKKGEVRCGSRRQIQPRTDRGQDEAVTTTDRMTRYLRRKISLHLEGKVDAEQTDEV